MFKRVFHLWLGLLAIAPPVLAGETLDIWRSDPTHIFDAKEVELSCHLGGAALGCVRR